MPDVVIKPGRVARWGNSAAVRIEAAALARAGLALNDDVEVIAGNAETIIRRQRRQLGMAELLEGFDPARHRHDLQLDIPGFPTPAWRR